MKSKSYHKIPCFYPDGSVNFYTPQLVSTTDYYAFGQIINARTHSTSGQKYRYNFNGKEIDDEIIEGAQDFGLRCYDNRLGKFLSIDPYSRYFPNKSTYSFAGNSPIKFIDKNGGYMVIPDVSASGAKLHALQRVAKAVSQMANENGGDNLFLQTFMSQSGVSKEKALEILTYGSGPVVVATSNANIIEKDGRKLAGVYTHYARTKEGKEVEGICEFIFINDVLLDNVNNNNDGRPSIISLMLAAITLWHEGMHYADYLDLDIQPENEAKEDIGTQAEIALFGFRADYDNLADNYKKTSLQPGSSTGMPGYSLRFQFEMQSFWNKYSSGNLLGNANIFGRPKNIDLDGIKNTLQSISKKMGKINGNNRDLETKGKSEDTGTHQNPRDLEEVPNSP